jgi:hypothetical protein
MLVIENDVLRPIIFSVKLNNTKQKIKVIIGFHDGLK